MRGGKNSPGVHAAAKIGCKICPLAEEQKNTLAGSALLNRVKEKNMPTQNAKIFSLRINGQNVSKLILTRNLSKQKLWKRRISQVLQVRGRGKFLSVTSSRQGRQEQQV